jgi:hypothetical protein
LHEYYYRCFPNSLMSSSVLFHSFIGIRWKTKTVWLLCTGKEPEHCIYFTSPPTSILYEFLEGRLHLSCLLSSVPRAVTGRVEPQQCLIHSILHLALTTQYCTLGHLIVNTISFSCVQLMCPVQNHRRLFRRLILHSLISITSQDCYF